MASSNSKIGQKLIACWTISTSTCPFEADRCRFTNMQHSRFGWGQIRTWIFSFLTLQTCMEVGPTRVNPIQDSNRGNLRIHFSLCWNKLMQHLTKSNAVLFFLRLDRFVWFWIPKTEVGGSEHSLKVVMRIARQTCSAYLPVHIDGNLVRKTFGVFILSRCVSDVDLSWLFHKRGKYWSWWTWNCKEKQTKRVIQSTSSFDLNN